MINTNEEIALHAPIKNPRISVNKLAEYIEANANRRKVIVQDCKLPKSFKVARYTEARKALVLFLKTRDHSVLERTITEITAKVPSSDFWKDDYANSIECLKTFLSFDIEQFNGLEITEHDENALVNINGLDISVNPELLIKHTHKGKDKAGAIKLGVLKAQMGKNQQETVAFMVKNYLQTLQLRDLDIEPSLCFSIDTFAKKLVSCPKAEKARMKLIGAACEEIMLRWPTA